MELSPGQAKAMDAIREWYTDATAGTGPPVFRMFGPAGTGKTTIARLVPQMAEDVLLASGRLWNPDELAVYFGAFSGKAANVLRSKGCDPASTLHSLIYGGPVNLDQIRKRTEAKFDEASERVTAARTAGDALAVADGLEEMTALREEIRSLTERIRLHGALEWSLNETSPLERAQLLICDEVSMVNDRMARDILGFGMPVLVLGDPEQLPPVGGEGFFTRTDPDVMLTEIHRQALDSPVLELATRVRTQGVHAIDRGEYTKGRDLDYLPFATAGGRILCWRRATRWGAVRYVRQALGRKGPLPEPGDLVMNLANNKDLGVFNGQTFTVLETAASPWGDDRLMLTVIEEGMGEETAHPIEVWAAGWEEGEEEAAGRQRLGSDGPVALMTHAHALTVHKAQGSEWANVCVIDETPAMMDLKMRHGTYAAASTEARRWLYTAITRASESVTLVRGRA